MEISQDKPVVAVAGATGFIGRALAPALGEAVSLRGLSRSARPDGRGGYATWRACDLFSLRDAERALEGAHTAVYLVHSMMPSARLTQGSFEDMDLICADNFARAANECGVQRIVYLGGLLPDDDSGLSRHLKSRREVEQALARYDTPLVTLRAGLVIGSGGSSWQILAKLVRRLPLMACPGWTQTLTQPIALPDVVTLLAASVTRADVAPGTYDVGGPDVLSYQAMMKKTAKAMGVRRPMLRVPLMTVGLSRLWVSLVTGAPKELVAPLIESLVHPMIAGRRELQEKLGVPGRSVDVALAEALVEERAAKIVVAGSPARRRKKAPPLARSVQRLSLPAGRDAAWVADEYCRWLPTWLLARVLRVEVDAEGRCRFYAPWMKRPLLELTLAHARSGADRVLFYITGGVLARQGGRPRLEFREVLGSGHVLAAVHDYRPALPWFVYASTQAVVHLAVMRAFGRHLDRLGRAASQSPSPSPSPAGLTPDIGGARTRRARALLSSSSHGRRSSLADRQHRHDRARGVDERHRDDSGLEVFPDDEPDTDAHKPHR